MVRRVHIAMRRLGRWLSPRIARLSERLAPFAARFRIWREKTEQRARNTWRKTAKPLRILYSASGALVLVSLVLLIVATSVRRGARLSAAEVNAVEGTVSDVSTPDVTVPDARETGEDMGSVTGGYALGETVLTKGMDAEIVVPIQERLMELEYMDFDDATTLFGPITSEAIRTFQMHNDLEGDGKCGLQTYELLMSEKAKPYVMQLGDSGDDVKEVQERLYSLGYISSRNSVDGKFGQATEDAVKDFQGRNKLSGVDGKVGARTLESLYDENPVSRTLQRGDKDDEVIKLKKRLKTLGYYNGDESNRFDSEMSSAVKEFQQRNGVQRDGCIGAETKQLLMSADAQPMVIMMGDSGDEVKQIQKELAKLKYLSSGNVTGYFGERTEEALQEFQGRNGLSKDGKAGAKTLNKLSGDDARAAATAKPTSKPTATSKPGTTAKPGTALKPGTTAKPSATDKPEVDVSGKKGVDKLIAIAESKLGSKYVRGAKGPNSFDCSGFAYWCLKQSGVSINYMTSFAWRTTNKFKRLEKITDVRAGDIIIFKMSATKGHVAIAISDNMMIDASSGNGKVVKRSFMSNWSKKNFYCAYRIF